MTTIQRISFIGAGNVATHLAKGLFDKGIQIEQIFSRTMSAASELANAVNAEPITNIHQLKEVDCILISIPDDFISAFFDQLKNRREIIAHTSGITGIEHLGNKTTRTAYFYPLQTFRKNQPLDLKTTPFFIEAKHNEDKKQLIHLAQLISNTVIDCTIEQKRHLHLSAVVVNNFVNHLYGFVKQDLETTKLDFSYLKPIIETTIQRCMNEDPFDIQTGPAIRGDEKTIQQHLTLIHNVTEYQHLYKSITKSIQEKHHGK